MYYCPRCKAKVPAEALYCTRCGFNATNARLNVLTNAPNTSNRSQRPGNPAQPQPGTSASHAQGQPRMPQVVPPTPTLPPAVPPAIRSIQPETRRVVHSHNANTPFAASTPPTPSSSLPNNVGQVIPATPPVLAPSMPQIPNTPIVATKGQTNPSIPTRPVPSHLQQPAQVHITPAHLMAIQQSPSAPSTPPTLLAPATPIYPRTSSVQPGQQFSPTPGPNTAQLSPAQSAMPQQSQQRQSEQPQPVTSNATRSAESYVATRNAAERWRTSWRNKQRSEAGPATEVSRGQSSVPEPLMAMQHSLARIRAIVKPQQRKKYISAFWLSIVLMVCLLVGLTIFILSTYTGNTTISNTIDASPTIPPPSLTVKAPQGVTVQAGQMLHVHGDHFAIGDPILFLLDGANSISGTDGKEIALQVSNQGTFDVDVPVTASWSRGPHVIEAEDNKTGQTAFLSIQVGFTTLNSVNSVPGLALSQSHLNFHAYIGQGNPNEQFITLNNRSNGAISWAAKAVTDDSLNWLAVDPTTTGGTIDTGSTAQVGIETITTGLKSNMPPYTGDILFSINGQEQLVVPVTLLTQDSAEWVFSPNPVTDVLSSQGGTCAAGTTLTLINLGNVPVFWHILTSNAVTNHIQFMLNGKVDMQGVLSPSGQNDDTQVLTLACNNVENGASYPFSVDANNILWNSTVLIQNS
jgi:hypothetical protein